MLGSAIRESLRDSDFEVFTPKRTELDLINLDEVKSFFQTYSPDVVIHCAARVGGIKMNIESRSVLFTENLAIDFNTITTAANMNVPRLIYIGSSCMYPANLDHPIGEISFMTGQIEPTNYSYGLAKIVGTEIVKSYREQLGLEWTTIVASNLYGPHDNFHPDRSHLLASVIRKVINARDKGLDSVTVWGDGESRREFTFVNDLADWIREILLKELQLPGMVNAGIGSDLTVTEWYQLVIDVAGYQGRLEFDLDQPVGNRRKLMDSSLAKNFGWHPTTSARAGITKTIEWYLNGNVYEES